MDCVIACTSIESIVFAETQNVVCALTCRYRSQTAKVFDIIVTTTRRNGNSLNLGVFDNIIACASRYRDICAAVVYAIGSAIASNFYIRTRVSDEIIICAHIDCHVGGRVHDCIVACTGVD